MENERDDGRGKTKGGWDERKLQNGGGIPSAFGRNCKTKLIIREVARELHEKERRRC